MKRNEEDNFRRTWKFFLPGDYIAYRLTGEIGTTETGLSEQILWDFKEGCRAGFVADCYGDSCRHDSGHGPFYRSPGGDGQGHRGASRDTGRHTAVLPCRRPAEQRILAECARCRRDCSDRGHERCRVRSDRHASGRPSVEGKHLHTREPTGRRLRGTECCCASTAQAS